MNINFTGDNRLMHKFMLQCLDFETTTVKLTAKFYFQMLNN